MNKLLKFWEPKVAIFAVVVFSGVLDLASYNSSEKIGRGLAGMAASVPGDSPTALLVKIIRYGIYAIALLLIIARFKTVVRPALTNPFLWVLVGLAVTSFIWSDFPSISRKEGLLTLVTTAIGLYLASRYSLKEQLQIVAWGAGIAAVFSLLYTLAFPGSGIEQGIHAGAWRGPLIQKNIFARLMVTLALPLLLVAMESRKYRYCLWTVFGLTVTLLLLSTSKTALLVFINLVILVPVYKALRWADSIAIPIVISLVLIGTSVMIWLISNWESFLGSLGRDATLTGRTEIWGAIIEKIWERPWLGYGYRAFWQPGGGQDYIWYVFHINFSQAHNGYLDLTAQVGLLGLLFFALSFMTAYIKAIAWVRLTRTSEFLWPIIYLTFIFMYNQTETTMIESNSLFWILYVSVTLSLNYAPAVGDSKYIEGYESEDLVERAW